MARNDLDPSDARKSTPQAAGGGFWFNLFRTEMFVQIVWAIVIGIVAVSALLVYAFKSP